MNLQDPTCAMCKGHGYLVNTSNQDETRNCFICQATGQAEPFMPDIAYINGHILSFPTTD